MHGLGDTTPTMENQMEKTMKTDMETVLPGGFFGDLGDTISQ